MKVYQVEYRAVITVEADDLQKAALDAAAAIKENPDLILLRAAHEINPESNWKHPRRPQRVKAENDRNTWKLCT
jgi:hypothetical protein